MCFSAIDLHTLSFFFTIALLWNDVRNLKYIHILFKGWPNFIILLKGNFFKTLIILKFITLQVLYIFVPQIYQFLKL